MSHYTVIKNTIITDMPILIKTLDKLGYEYKENHSIEGHTGRRNALLAVKIGTRYCVGFNRISGVSGFSITADWGAAAVQRKDFLKSLYQTYNTEKVIAEARVRGYSVLQQTQSKSGIKIVLRKVG
jgi:hypothetical protein